MNFEKTSVEADNTKEKTINRIYPERMFSRIDGEIERIKKIENGEIEKIELTDSEKEEVLRFEDSLGEKLEEIEDIKVNHKVFYPEYFLTKEGKEEFLKVVGIEVIGDTLEDIEYFLLQNRAIFDTIDDKKLSSLVGKSRVFCDDKNINLLTKALDDDGNIKIDELDNSVRVKIILNPEDALDKIQKLRQFKKGISINNKTEESVGDNVEIAKEKIKNLYRKKVNLMISRQVHSGIWATELANSLGAENLTEGEMNLKRMVPGLIEFEKVFSRYDKFVYGADAEYDEAGMRRQVGAELLKYADKIDEKFINTELERDQKIIEKGLDPKKIDENNISAEEFIKWTEEMFEFYGEKSAYSAETYNEKRAGAAPDNKWQFVARGEYDGKALCVDSKQKVIRSGLKNKSVVKCLSTLLGHEYTHFIQAINQKVMPLRLLSENIDELSTIVFSEGGAMATENDVTMELFGYERSPKSHYIRAMAKKLEGGNYAECVKAYFDSSRKSLVKKRAQGLISDDDFKKEIKKRMKTSVKSAKRLFQGSDKFDRSVAYLTDSDDTSYAEQVIVMEKLRENRLEKCAFIRGLNLDTLATLMEIGLIDLDKIQKPNLDFVRKVWEEKKSDYELK